MLPQLTKYLNKITTFEQSVLTNLQNFQNQLIQQFTAYVSKILKYHYQHNYTNKHRNFKAQTTTLEYYINKYKKVDEQEEQEEYDHNNQVHKVNLFAVFKEIDEKIQYNCNLLKDVEVSWGNQEMGSYVQNGREYWRNRAQLLAEYLQEINGLLNAQNPDAKVKGLMKQAYQIQNRYDKNLADQQKHKILPLDDTKMDNLPAMNISNLTIKNTPAAICMDLSSYKYLEEIDLSIVSVNKGIMSIDEYERLFEVICSRNRISLKKLKIKLMDMQFCQEKCDLIKRKLKSVKYLNSFTIYNYYSECKLGHFAKDFNWKPYREGVNIGTKVWK